MQSRATNGAKQSELMEQKEQKKNDGRAKNIYKWIQAEKRE